MVRNQWLSSSVVPAGQAGLVLFLSSSPTSHESLATHEAWLRIKMPTLVQIGVKLVSIGLQKCTKCMIHKHKDDLQMYIKVCV